MNRVARLIGIVLCLLAVFLAAVLASGLRLRRQTATLRQAAIETRKHQLERALAVTRPASLPWSGEYLKDLGAIVDANVSLSRPNAPRPARADIWSFEYPIAGDDGRIDAVLLVNFLPPPAARLGDLYRSTALALLVLALGLLTVLVVVAIVSLGGTDPKTDPASLPAGGGTAPDFSSLTHLAKRSAAQQLELEKERNERLRADEDIHYQQVLLNRALEEKIKLGQELHDGIIQSLYATGLTLEAAKKNLPASATEASAHLDAGLKALNATIREVRSYILGLAPENLQQQNFAKSVQSLVQTLGGGRKATFDVRIDETASAKLSDERSTNLLQIVREAISNSFRHGDATQITVRLHENAQEIGLLIQDNGRGFDAARAARGHGLDNIQARAERIHAALRMTSAPGDGTRVVVTLPLLES